ncbi:MAG: nitrile hydratase accessory protein [Rhizobiales bacterium]|nr:nitrile hydratase accessory protein [Hyphomicrobiales bacterium]
MSPSETDALKPLKKMDTEPVFEELWQAQVLAMADAMVNAGAFEAAAWSEALGRELKAAEAAGADDTAQTYYEAALRALEGLLAQNDAVPAATLEERREAWKQAYLATPHGSPVELANAARGRN